MKWPRQAVVLFGFLASFTIPMERSSAASLRVLRNEDETVVVGGPLNAEHVSGESDLRCKFKDIIAQAKEQLKKIRENVRKEIEKIEKEDINAVTEEALKCVEKHLEEIREETIKIVYVIGGEPEIAAAIDEITKQIDDAIKNIHEKVQRKNSNETNGDDDFIEMPNFAERAKAQVRKVRDEARKEIQKINTAGIGKESLERIKARLEKIRERAEKLVDILGETEIGAGAKEVIKQIDDAIKNIRAKIRGRKHNEFNDENMQDQDLIADELLEEIQIKALNLQEFNGQNQNETEKEKAKRIELAKTRLAKVREDVATEAKKINTLGEGPQFKEAARIIKAHLEMSRDYAKIIGEAFKKTDVEAKANEVIKEAEEAIKKITEKMSMSSERQRLARLRQDVIAEAKKIDDLGKTPNTNAKEIAKAIKARLEACREYAKVIGEANKGNYIEGEAKDVVQEAEAAIKKVNEKASKLPL